MERPGGGSVVTGSAIGCGRRISLIGEFARTGRLPFPPLSELTYSPGRGCRLPSPVAGNLPIVLLVMCGSLWIMANLNHNMMPMDQLMQMQR
jgi:hypothetical protein